MHVLELTCYSQILRLGYIPVSFVTSFLLFNAEDEIFFLQNRTLFFIELISLQVNFLKST